MLADVRLVRLEEDGLGLAFIKDSTLHLWAREVADDGASKWKWIPRRAIELDKFLPMPRVLTGKWCGEMFVSISGFSEDGNVVFIRTLAGVFLVWLEALKFKKMSDPLYMMTVHPYSSFYVPNGMGSSLSFFILCCLVLFLANEKISSVFLLVLNPVLCVSLWFRSESK